MQYYAKPDYYDLLPELFDPTKEQFEIAGQQVLQFISDEKKSDDEIVAFLLVELGYTESHGATINHVRVLLNEMVKRNYLKCSIGDFYL